MCTDSVHWFLVPGSWFLVLGSVDAAVEAAKLEPHSWQAAKLSSVGGALSEGTIHGPMVF